MLNHEVPPFVAFQQFPPLRGQLQQMGIDPTELARQYEPPRTSVTAAPIEVNAEDREAMRQAKERYEKNAPARAEAAAARAKFQQDLLNKPGGYRERREAVERYGSSYGGNLGRLREEKRQADLQQQQMDIEKTKANAALLTAGGNLSEVDAQKYALASEAIKTGNYELAAAILRGVKGFEERASAIKAPGTP